ncbi:MAG: translocation/assembly module TamB [Prevotella sp.]|nr:translocation/assembly module TamB [Prevotella sp.]
MRIFKWIFSIVLWTVIALNVIAFGVTRLPVTQRFLGDKVSGVASDLLGTQVSVGRVDLGLPSRLILDDLVIHDQQQKEMIRAARVSVNMDILPMLEGKVAINSAQLFGARLRLYKPNADAQTNFQFLIDSLASKDTTTHKPLDVRVNSLIVRHTSVAYDQLDKPETEGHFNPAHLQIDDISAHINLRALTDDSLNVNVKRLSFNERSGLAVNRLGFRVEADRQHALLRDFLLEMPSTQMKIDTLTASYQLNGQELVKGSLSFSSNISDTYITPSDLRCFEPTLKNYQRPLFLTAAVNGSDLRLNIPNFRLNTSEDDIDIHVDGWLEDYQHPSAWHLQMHRIQLSDASIDFLSKVIPGCPPEITRLDGLQMLGTFDKEHNGLMSLQSTILSGAGNIEVHGTMDRQQHFDCLLQTEELNLRQLLNTPDLGSLIARISLHGNLPPPSSHLSPLKDIQAEGIISHFDFKGYPYQNIHIDGDYANNTLSGAASIDDPNVKLDLMGQLSNLITEARHARRDVMIDGVINHFAPAALHLSDELEEGIISGDIHADFTASNLNDAQGTVRISNAGVSATASHRAYRLDNLIVTTGYDNDIHFVSLKSDFADATIRGEFDYATLPQSVIGLVGTRLPTLPGLPPVRHDTNNNFSLRLMMSKTDWLQRFFGIDLVLRQPLMLNARVNDHTREIYLEGDIPAFTYNGAQYADGIVNISTPGDTLQCDVGISKLLGNGQAMTAVANLRAANNKLNTSLSWDNHNPAQQVSGQMNGIIQLYHNLYNEPEAHMRVMPSHIVLKDGLWEVEPADIIYNKHHLLVDNFMVHRGKQHILIDGIASKSHHDSLSVDLNQVEVEYILDLVNFHSVEFGGKATGRATGRALFDKFAATADIRVDDFKFENGRMGVLHANANWNQDAEQIDISAVAKDGPGVNTYVNGFISPVHNTIDLDIRADSTYIDFMHSFTHSFLSQITGHTSGDVRLAGTLDNINLTGQLVVGGNLTVEALNATYYLDRDTVTFIPDDILLNRLPLHDRDGNMAYLSGGIHHRHLTHLTFDLQAEADNLLAYDFHDFGESSFYGTVYASGTVTIEGRPGEVSIDCNVTPQKNSFFVYNAANPDAVSRSEFIVWEDSSRKEEGGKRNENSPAADSAEDSNLLPPSSLLPPRERTDIYLNLLITATPDATLRLLMDANTNDYITLNGDGNIRATYHNKGAFNMFGTYNVDHGTYGVTIQNIIKKNFIFNPGGTIIFSGDPYQAALNLQAVHTVSGVSLSDLNIGNSFSSNTIRVNCLMNISGIAAAPQVDFDLEMPTVNADEQQMIRTIINGQQEMNQQVIYLLAIGRFYTQGVNSMANNPQNDQTSLAMQSLLSGTLSAQINNVLNQFLKNDNWNFGANITTGNEGWHNAEYEGIVNARMLNNRLLFNGQFGYRDNAKQATPSFIGDFDVQYLLYPNGNLALKVYNQTNDRYFTKSSLNTQGLGIIMKKDFNGLRDLFTSQKRKKKKNKM